MNPHPIYPLPVNPMNLFHAVGQDLKFLDGRLWHGQVKWDEWKHGGDEGKQSRMMMVMIGGAGAVGGCDQNQNPLLCSHVFI